jgi:hypothetical protein
MKRKIGKLISKQRIIHLVILVVAVVLGLLYIINDTSSRKLQIDNYSDYNGIFIRTNDYYFFVADSDSQMFIDKEIVKIFPADNSVIFDTLNSGDKVFIEILTVGDLSPRVMDIYHIDLLEKGDMSNIDESIIASLESLGYQIK